jgi:hypothetical protein
VEAVMLNPGGDSPMIWLVALASVGLLVGFAWLHRIASLDDDPDGSSFRSGGRRHRRASRIPDAPDMPTRGWLLTRGAIVIGAAAVAFALVGPVVMRRWIPAFETGAIGVLLWVAAILAAAVGTGWMIRIAVHGPEDGPARWRSRR